MDGPHEFTDEKGRVWSIHIAVSDLKRVRRAGIDIFRNGVGLQDIATLMADPVTLVDVIYVLCQERARALNVSDEDFGRAMRGDVIAEATRALLGAIASFTPNPMSAALRRGIEDMDRAMPLVAQAIAEAKTPEDLERLLRDRLAESTPGKPSTNSPEPSASTRTSSPCASSCG